MKVNFFKSIFHRISSFTASKFVKNDAGKHRMVDSGNDIVRHCKTPIAALLVRRYFSSEPAPHKLNLMQFNHILWPNVIKSVKNWIYAALIVRPYFDPEFHLGSFVDGAKQAAEVVSNYLAEGKLDELQGLLTGDCISQIKSNLAHLSTTQRHELGIKKDDIYFSFPYELGVIFDDSNAATGRGQTRHVEVTVVHHVLRGHSDMLARGEPIPLNIGVLPEYRDKIFILNYRFIRNYSKGVHDQWTLNVVNHFKPAELAN